MLIILLLVYFTVSSILRLRTAQCTDLYILILGRGLEKVHDFNSD